MLREKGLRADCFANGKGVGVFLKLRIGGPESPLLKMGIRRESIRQAGVGA